MEEEVVGKAYDSRLMRRLLSYMRPYWQTVAVSLFLLLINSGFQILGPLITLAAVDRYLVPAGRRMSWLDWYLSADPWTGLTQLSAVYLAIIAAGLLLEFGQVYLMQRTGQHAMFDLRRQLMAHLQRLDVG
ncbi:MAG TPA: ABC transporter transmembrane domain-containing protein, partial [Bryobacteraceae bacterium]|nr:ABC transporter transmembrane domain-containing protein [Bryobacteraceae bacterium]